MSEPPATQGGPPGERMQPAAPPPAKPKYHRTRPLIVGSVDADTLLACDGWVALAPAGERRGRGEWVDRQFAKAHGLDREGVARERTLRFLRIQRLKGIVLLAELLWEMLRHHPDASTRRRAVEIVRLGHEAVALDPPTALTGPEPDYTI